MSEARARYAAELVGSGAITDPRWAEAFATVPREVFTPRFFLHHPGGGMRAVAADDPGSLASVYSDLTLVTQLDGDDRRWTDARERGPIAGRPTSSSTQPTLMAWMLDALDPRPGDQVLEVGTGTGYHAALLCHVLGDQAVHTVDIDPGVVAAAVDALARVGYRPDVAVADAVHGHPPGAPYDALISTCAWPVVPASWLDQVRPGGRILTHVHTDLDAGALVLLTRHADATASGPVLARYGSFMTRRDHTPPDTLARLRRALRTTDIPRRTVAPPLPDLTDDDFSLHAALHVPDVAVHWFQPVDAPGMQTWLLAGDGSAAHQEIDDGDLVTVETGPRSLGDELARAHRDWRDLGRPTRDRYLLTVDADGQHWSLT